MNSQTAEDILQLIEDCKKNSRKAQHRLFKFFYSSMFSICMRYAGDYEEAQDMLNEGFIKIFSNLDKYESTGSFEGWMKRVMANSAVDYQRKYKTNIETVDYEMIPDEVLQNHDENYALSNISTDELLQLIQKLPNMSRTIFNLNIFEGYSHKEIAQMLHIKEGTSHWHLNFARTRLKEQILKRDKE